MGIKVDIQSFKRFLFKSFEGGTNNPASYSIEQSEAVSRGVLLALKAASIEADTKTVYWASSLIQASISNTNKSIETLQFLSSSIMKQYIQYEKKRYDRMKVWSESIDILKSDIEKACEVPQGYLDSGLVNETSTPTISFLDPKVFSIPKPKWAD